MIYKFGEAVPQIDSTCFIAENSTVIGKVTLGHSSSLWFGAVVRGDIEEIRIGNDSNVQDNSTVHTDIGFPVEIGDGVSIGHNCVIHGCTIGDNSLIGMGSIVLKGACIGAESIIGAGSLVTQHAKIPSGVLCVGAPARVIRNLTEGEKKGLRENAAHYVEIGEIYRLQNNWMDSCHSNI